MLTLSLRLDIRAYAQVNCLPGLFCLNKHRKQLCAQTSMLDGLQTLLPRLPAAGRISPTVLRKRPLPLEPQGNGPTATLSRAMTMLYRLGGTRPRVHLIQISIIGRRVYLLDDGQMSVQHVLNKITTQVLRRLGCRIVL
jgi:hypothetical protein